MILSFPTPLPLFKDPQDIADAREVVNILVNYINTIYYSTDPSNNALLKAQNLADLTSVAAAIVNLGIGTAGLQDISYFDLAGAAAAAQAAAEAASDPAGSAAAAQAAAEAASDPAGSAAAVAAAKANKGINSDITALTDLSVIQKSANYQVAAGDQTIEVDATSGAVVITYLPATAAGRVTIIKTDATFNAVSLSDGTNTIFSLTSPMIGGYGQAVTVYTNGAALRAF